MAEYEVGSLEGDWVYDLNNIVVYGRDGCQFCASAKESLAEHGISYAYIDLTDITERTKFFDERGFLGKDRTMPKVYALDVGTERYVGGFNELHAALAITT